MDFKPVQTRASQLLKGNNDFKVIVFEEPKAAKRQKPETRQVNENIEQQTNNNNNYKLNPPKNSKSKAEDDLEFDIKKARHEVLRFAMSNQRTIKNKKKMEVFQAIKLGAKPPKKPYKNYKDLIAERKRLKDIRAKRRELGQLGKNQAGLASVKCRSKTKLEKLNKKKAPVSSIDQHYGKARPKLK